MTPSEIKSMDAEERQSLDEAVYQRVIRFSELEANPEISLACKLEKYERTNYVYVGSGDYFSSGGRHPAQVEGQHYAVAVLECEPGKGPSLHCHTTEETFFALAGQLEVYWGENGEHTAVLQPLDAAVFPPGVWHGVRNAGEGTARLMAIIGEGNPAPPIFAPIVEAELEGLPQTVGSGDGNSDAS
jgi:quercetin dioxygenase-like cupin family protein